MLSKKTKYGLKALSYLAKKKQFEPVLISEISEAENISKKFLESILLILKKDGILSLYGLAFKNFLPMKLEVSPFFIITEEETPL